MKTTFTVMITVLKFSHEVEYWHCFVIFLSPPCAKSLKTKQNQKSKMYFRKCHFSAACIMFHWKRNQREKSKFMFIVIVWECVYSNEICSVMSTFHSTLQSTVGKKMAAVHFTTIPCKPNTANRHTESHIFWEIRPSSNNIVYATVGLKFLELFCAFLWAFFIWDVFGK